MTKFSYIVAVEFFMLFKKDHRLVECLCIVEAKKFGQLKPFFSQQKIENRIAKNASNRPLRPFFLSIGFKPLLLSFGLLPTFFDFTFFFFTLVYCLPASGNQRQNSLFWSNKMSPILIILHAKFCQNGMNEAILWWYSISNIDSCAAIVLPN